MQMHFEGEKSLKIIFCLSGIHAIVSFKISTLNECKEKLKDHKFGDWFMNWLKFWMENDGAFVIILKVNCAKRIDTSG